LLTLIGSLIGFSGTVLTDHVQLECLTDCFTLHANPYEDATAIRVARAFGAFRIAVGKLDEHYKRPAELHTPDRALRVTFPYPDSCTTSDGSVELTYQRRFDEAKLIFLATTMEGTTVLVKFTRRYSEAAHRFCAKAGVAPELVGFLLLPTGWYMVVMQYLDAETFRILDPSDGSNTRLVAGIREVVKILHGGEFVHGDIRYVNMMTRRQWTGEGVVGNVFLIDFDWAGRDGIVEYPPKLNVKSVKRHEAAKDGEPIFQEHDWVMVENMF
jgi:hypothetical protein